MSSQKINNYLENVRMIKTSDALVKETRCTFPSIRRAGFEAGIPPGLNEEFHEALNHAGWTFKYAGSSYFFALPPEGGSEIAFNQGHFWRVRDL